MTDIIDEDVYLPDSSHYDYIDPDTGHAMAERVDIWGKTFEVDMTVLYRPGPNAGSAIVDGGDT